MRLRADTGDCFEQTPPRAILGRIEDRHKMRNFLKRNSCLGVIRRLKRRWATTSLNWPSRISMMYACVSKTNSCVLNDSPPWISLLKLVRHATDDKFTCERANFKRETDMARAQFVSSSDKTEPIKYLIETEYKEQMRYYKGLNPYGDKTIYF